MTTRALRTTFLATLAILAALCGCGDDSGDDGGGGSGAGTGGGESGNGGSAGHAGGGGSGGAGKGGASGGGASGMGGKSGAGGAGGAGGSAGTGGTGGTGGASGTAGAGGSAGGNTDDTPITERESDGAFACTVGQPLINYKPTTWGYAGGNIVGTGDGEAWLVRLEAKETAPFTPGPYSFVISQVNASGEIADGTIIDVDDVDMVTSPRGIALASGGLAALWIESGALWFVALDGDGAIEVAPKKIASGNALIEANNLQLAQSGGGKIAAVWNTQATNTPYIAVTDGAGANATPARFEEPSGYTPRIVGTPAGFALMWRSFDPDFMDPSNVFFALRGGDGKPVGEPVQLTDFDANFGGSFGGSDLALLPQAGGFLVAWGEGDNGDFDTNTGAYSVIRVQQLSGEGEARGESVLVAPRTDNIDQVEPSFVPWDADTLALLWASGSHIYICGGCVPDHSVRMVLIDANSLSPRSNVVEVEPAMGGLLGRSHAVSGSDLLVSVGIQFHVHFEPGFAALRCE